MAGWGYPQMFNDNYTRYRVANMEAGKAFPCGANASVILWDAQHPVFYLKETDAGGFMTNFEAYDFTRKDISEPNPADYATKQEISELAGMIAGLTAALQAQQQPQITTTPATVPAGNPDILKQGADANAQPAIQQAPTGQSYYGTSRAAQGSYAGGYQDGVRPAEGKPGA